jgi:hypothetical protein
MYNSNEQRLAWFEFQKVIAEVPAVPCTNYPDLFHEDNTMVLRDAVKLCAVCPIRAECLAYALKHENEGFWGGLRAAQRRRITGLNKRHRYPTRENRSTALLPELPTF